MPSSVTFFSGWDQPFRADPIVNAWRRDMLPIISWESRPHRTPMGKGSDNAVDEKYRLSSIIDGDFDPYRIVDSAFDEWIGPKGHFSGHPKDLDPLGIYKLMVRYIPILDKVGVKVTCKKPSSKEKTRWTIEGPAWDFGDLERIIARLWFEQHSGGSARDIAS